jgi:signal transduction histidine kinase
MDEFYAAAIHEVKNQLAELALRLGNRPDLQTEMRIAMHASHSLTEMLLLQRQSAGQLHAQIDHVNPADFLDILVAEYRGLFPGLEIRIDSQQAPECAFFDETLVRLALSNGLHNACRYAIATIQIRAYQDGNWLLFDIQDDGSGFPATLLSAEFERPLRASGGGTGLGLYLAHKIAHIHQAQGMCGNITLTNNDTGALFRMTLPD